MTTVVYVAQCGISDLAASRPTVEAVCLGAAERARLAQAPLRRLAGVIAAKRAVLQALGAAAGTIPAGFTECAVEIGHAADGAPCLQGLTPPLRQACGGQRIHISISHTGDHAYGLAAIEAEP